MRIEYPVIFIDQDFIIEPSVFRKNSFQDPDVSAWYLFSFVIKIFGVTPAVKIAHPDHRPRFATVEKCHGIPVNQWNVFRFHKVVPGQVYFCRCF
jgi:hypothetical protein